MRLPASGALGKSANGASCKPQNSVCASLDQRARQLNTNLLSIPRWSTIRTADSFNAVQRKHTRFKLKLAGRVEFCPCSNGHLAAALKFAQQGAFGRNTGARFRMVE
jgi:hypothetical protein